MHGAGNRTDEEAPLLGSHRKSTEESKSWLRVKRHMTADVSKHWADAVLLFCYIITGLLDSSAVFIWGSFVSMQTGNTVYLGLGLVAPSEGIRWIKAVTSIGFFCLGSFFFSHFHRILSPRKRWVLVASYFLQMLLIVLAAMILTFGSSDHSDDLNWQVLVPLASVAFQSSGQAVISRVFHYTGLTSVVLTSNYCDLFGDAKLFDLSNVERNRRLAAPALLLLGAVIGGFWAHSSVGMAGALWTAVGLKAVIVAAWFFWPAASEGEW
ncbi:hypothetical protein BU24DRAFT_433526 [Aaosphaeria arxii CBS 175.79]|uniref:DUF1275 domain protein n=1 Tax=Aaosphaeria arxii CBS 175.79 TaxID=1450172 RepID=A0A6A5XV98_9PLEO|nr:uncharacterized protein BU24DRAFT_433526 [Aaosphaeria arxii CBS 175.79]KAF2016641.1 hypothetical protein BU24DRAFT_433526 [Aaosphaeria arxii CBS 175.79]